MIKNRANDIINEIKQKPLPFIVLGIIMISFTFVFLNSLGKTTKTKPKQTEKKVALKPKEKINDKLKNKEKLIASTNPEARQGELKKKIDKYKEPTATVLKNKYTNAPLSLSETVMNINKEKKKRDEKLEKLEAELKKQKELIAKRDKELEEIKKKLKSNINTTSKYTNNYNSIKKQRIEKSVIFLKPEVKKKLLEEAFATDTDNTSFQPLYVPSENKNKKLTAINKNEEIKTIKNEVRFNIVPGSSFYGRLETPLYSQYTNMDAIITVYNTNFNNCKFLGKVKYLKFKGMTIDIDRVACDDGYEQSVSAKAVRMSDLKPVFSDSVDRHILPKVVLGTLDALINYQRIDKSTTTTTNGTTVVNTQNATLVDEILKNEYERYKEDEEIANPQSLVVIFY